MGKRISFAAAAAVIALGACATPYQETGMRGGFSEVLVAPQTYKIMVRGNGFSSPGRVHQMALLRSAELANNAGYSHFLVLSQQNADREVTSTTGGYSTSTTTGNVTDTSLGGQNSAFINTQTTTAYTPPSTSSTTKPGADFIVQFVPEGTPNALSVAEVYAMYGEKYGLKL